MVLLALGGFLVLFFVKEAIKQRQEMKKWEKGLLEDYKRVTMKQLKPQRVFRLKGFYNHHRSSQDIDDITWKDLELDAVFQRINTSLSASGEEYLYYMLRHCETSLERLNELEKKISFFQENPAIRIQTQRALRKLGFTEEYSLYDYMEYLDDLQGKSCIIDLLADACMLASLGIIFVSPIAGSMLLLGCIIFNFIYYYRQKNEINPYIQSFLYMIRLIHCGKELSSLNASVLEQELSTLNKELLAIRGLDRKFRIFSLFHGSGMSGNNPLEILMDYVKMLFHFDIIAFYKMYQEFQDYKNNIDALYSVIGSLECYIMIGKFRATLTEGYSVPDLWKQSRAERSSLRVEKLYHLFVENPVKNSLTTDNSILITGSNASGKSTFLKALATNAILSQTIHTALASEYKAPIFRIFTSLSVQDNLWNQESYYIAEIKSIKRILDSRELYEEPILCFVDEVLRGTNTIERVAAATEILRHLSKTGLLFAATHDMELTELLKDTLDNYHFEERMEGEDIHFPYILYPGRTESRNAIQLLRLLGYQEDIISAALQRAQLFENTGKWY